MVNINYVQLYYYTILHYYATWDMCTFKNVQVHLKKFEYRKKVIFL